MFVLGGDWQNTRAGASGDCVVTIPVLALVEYPEKGSKEECDQLSDACGDGGSS